MRVELRLTHVAGRCGGLFAADGRRRRRDARSAEGGMDPPIRRDTEEVVVRFLIVGAGALGGYYGGMLLKGGADVAFLVRPQRAAQLAARGLVVKNPEGDFVSPAKTLLAGEVDGPYDIVLMTCKAYDL